MKKVPYQEVPFKGTSLTEVSDQLKVKDEGVGIPLEDLPYIFERFYRVDQSRDKETGGAGIGLTITKEIVEAHGGKIAIESIPGHGTEVIVTLPKRL